MIRSLVPFCPPGSIWCPKRPIYGLSHKGYLVSKKTETLGEGGTQRLGNANLSSNNSSYNSPAGRLGGGVYHFFGE